jgi:hypothetical protein
MTSPDGINWTARTAPMNNSWMSVCYGNGTFVAVSSTGGNDRVMMSPDGINWILKTSATNNNWVSVCYGNGMFAAVAAVTGTGNRVMTCDVIRDESRGVSKSIQSFGKLTATYISANIVRFDLKPYLADTAVWSADNFLVEFTAIQKVTTAYAVTFGKLYDPSTGILQVATNNAMFASGTTAANIYLMA